MGPEFYAGDKVLYKNYVNRIEYTVVRTFFMDEEVRHPRDMWLAVKSATGMELWDLAFMFEKLPIIGRDGED